MTANATKQAKETTLFKVALACIALWIVSLMLLIPGVLVYKLAHGASQLKCLEIVAVYGVSCAATLFLIGPLKKRSAVLAVVFGLCYYGLLFLSLKL